MKLSKVSPLFKSGNNIKPYQFQTYYNTGESALYEIKKIYKREKIYCSYFYSFVTYKIFFGETGSCNKSEIDYVQLSDYINCSRVSLIQQSR